MIQAYVQQMAGDGCDVILGMGHDPSLNDKIGVTVIATGFHHNEIRTEMPFRENEPKKINVVLGDINAGMLSVGRDRLTNRGLVLGLDYVQCNAEALPFPDNSFDLVTIAFGLRNVTDKDAGLREMYRVLKVGGQARVLEFSEVTADWFKPIYDFHSFKILPKLGKLFANDSDSYQYLAESIRKHPPQDELKAMMGQAGFERCHYKNLTGGIVSIHSGYKL